MNADVLDCCMILHHLEIQHLPAPPHQFLPAEIDRNRGLPVEYTIPAHPPPSEIALLHWLTVVLFVLDPLSPLFHLSGWCCCRHYSFCNHSFPWLISSTFRFQSGRFGIAACVMIQTAGIESEGIMGWVWACSYSLTYRSFHVALSKLTTLSTRPHHPNTGIPATCDGWPEGLTKYRCTTTSSCWRCWHLRCAVAITMIYWPMAIAWSQSIVDHKVWSTWSLITMCDQVDHILWSSWPHIVIKICDQNLWSSHVIFSRDYGSFTRDMLLVT